ncbi:GNAT family N-acetyltransferase [Ornithinibacillus salinisoli]|uniref:GNAT family N-acetyltransferase n=1 Tax=Ornithinibacillus salinisoli TaxID=1848459 RepID=A0ABW4W4J6_9BACI
MSSENHCICIAILDESIVGYGWLQDYGPHLRTGKTVHRFHDLFVLSDYRNRGAARAIFEYIIKWSELQGATWLQWNANPNSISFYEKLGYTSLPEEEEGYPFYEINFIQKSQM